MEEFASHFLTAIDEAALPQGDGGEDDGHQKSEPDAAKKGRGFRSGIFSAANLQDSLLEK
jgi:hypothetical protein